MKICKRFGALLLALVLTFSLSVTAFAAVEDTGFSDVDADDWFAASAVYVRDNGIMNGTSATTFDPNGTTSRGQITAILYRAAGSPAVSDAVDFPDVAPGAYYADAAVWAAANGIVTGYADGTFRPNDPITRQQMAAILWRYAGSPAAESGTDYADESAIAAYAVTASRTADQHDDVARAWFFPLDVCLRGSADHSAHFHALGDIALIIDLLHIGRR